MASRQLSAPEFETCQEHFELREAVEYIRQLLAGGRASRVVVLHLLRDLRAILLEHFHEEERGGYFAEARQETPHWTGRVEGLLGQHPQLIDMLDALIARSPKQIPLREWWQGLAADYAAFESLFLRHEAGENALLLEMYGDDLGEGD